MKVLRHKIYHRLDTHYILSTKLNLAKRFDEFGSRWNITLSMFTYRPNL